MLARSGVDVAVAARTGKEIEAVADEIGKLGRRSIPVVADVSDEDDAGRVVTQTLAAFGRIDILVNNAGVGTFARVVDMATTDFDRMFATNVRGVFLVTRAALPSMIKQQSGDIINIASLAGRNAFIGGAGYGATKWALIGFARSLMLEVRQYDIRVITICPGSVATSFDPRSTGTKDAERIPKPEDIARVVLDVLRMPRNVMVSEVDVRPTNPNWK
jgi:3-oxoacyl-[acyl-carrier protein] reductase